MAEKRYYLNLDENGYLLSVFTVPETDEQPDVPYVTSLDGIDFTDNHAEAYRWNGKELVLDAERLDELIDEQENINRAEQIRILYQRLRDTDGLIVDALESILSATSLTGLLSAIISAATSVRETIKERNEIRERIKELLTSWR